jgi:hypothetical protein
MHDSFVNIVFSLSDLLGTAMIEVDPQYFPIHYIPFAKAVRLHKTRFHVSQESIHHNFRFNQTR